uniref:Chromosome transmission fidelity protein 18 homolog n=1 Tax=Saccoglossus kowalevskii TaxID=10224 RepID=A0ABM0MDL2_SACKO|nr:PREDICTED: chromosome transmission fidelity protein 18 homolog [Saccoglossus kowalevskii]
MAEAIATNFPPVSKKSLHFTTPKHNHNIEKKLDNSPLPVLGELLSPEQSQAITNNVIENDAPKMRKVTNGRVVVEDELNFLESPKRKRRRISPNLAIDDDDFEITPPASPDADEKIMMKIKQHRQQKSCNFNTTLEPNETETRTLSRDVNHTTVHVLRRQPQGKHLTVTGHDGERVYVKVRDDDKLVDKTKIVVYGNRSDGSLQLLSTSIDVLREIIEEKRTNQLLEESQRISDELEREVNENRVIAKRDGNETKTGSLWVDKYGPQQYSELLSDDGTNRTLLRWLKLWDYVVYGKEYKPKEEKKKTTKPNMKKWGANVPEVVEELDEHKRPVHKVALLCGPPGLGKTTLAHVIAKHAGYNVIEMNASDDRSAEIFRTRIESATQMKSVLGPDQKPNCLIIDEIDGAPAPAINVLLSVIKRKDTAASAPEPSQFGIPGKKKKKKQTMLLRPIICICNDQFTPSLRQLRQQSLIVQFPPTLSTRLATRLNEIARNNYLKTDQTTLLALCQKAENDIRSCINTLQFIRGQFSQLTLQMINSMSIGQKDQHKGLFAVWNEIFQLPRVSK